MVDRDLEANVVVFDREKCVGSEPRADRTSQCGVRPRPQRTSRDLGSKGNEGDSATSETSSSSTNTSSSSSSPSSSSDNSSGRRRRRDRQRRAAKRAHITAKLVGQPIAQNVADLNQKPILELEVVPSPENDLTGNYYNKYIRNKKSPEDNCPSPEARTQSLIMNDGSKITTRVCLFCPKHNMVDEKNYFEHLVIQHGDCLFKCSMCVDELEGSKFESFNDIRNHVQETHSVNNEDGVRALIKVPFVMNLRKYKCRLCQDVFEATTESELTTFHFKEKHNAQKVTSKMLLRICRICGESSWKSDAELIKHIGQVHPRSDFDDDDDDDDDDNDDHEQANDRPAIDNLEQEMLSEKPLRNVVPLRDSIVTGKVKESPARTKHRSQPSSDSVSSSDSKSGEDTEPETERKQSKKKKKKKKSSKTKRKRKLSDTESRTTTLDFEPEEKRPMVTKADIECVNKLRKTRSKDSRSDGELSEDDKKLEAGSNAIKEAASVKTISRSSSRKRRSSENSKSRERNNNHHSQSTGNSKNSKSNSEIIFCKECRISFPLRDSYRHYSSRDHYSRIRNLIRCYLCSKYVPYTKDHLEECHVGEVFQCKLTACSRPKFLDLVKVLNHMDDKHYSETRNKSNEDLIRRNMIGIPRNLHAYKCKLCQLLFVGQRERDVLEHQRREHIDKPSASNILYQCRVCGPKVYFRGERDLEKHVQTHRSPSDRALFRGRRSRSSSRSSSGRSRRSSSSRSDSSPSRPRRKYVPCSFCHQVTEDMDKDKRQHAKMHQKLNFNCQKCDFGALDRFEVMDHVGSAHQGAPTRDDEYFGPWISLPMDLRRIFCYECRALSDKRVEWCARSIEDCRNDFETHCRDEHKGKSVEYCIYLGCRACNDHQYITNPLNDWKIHHKDHGIWAARNMKGPESPKLSANPISEPPTAAMSPACCYCCESLSPETTIETHIRRNHMSLVYQCKLCPTVDQRIFTDEGQIKHHVDRDHSSDARQLRWRDWIQVPQDLRSVICKLCMETFYALGSKEIQETHWRHQHPNAKFRESHLEFKCRACENVDEFEDEQELEDHFKNSHSSQLSETSHVVDGDTTIVSTTTSTKGSSPIPALSTLAVSPPPPPSIPPIVQPAIVPAPLCDPRLGSSSTGPHGPPYSSTSN
ncbi:hypothetical protein TCAL_04217 [Tigriopus californicus]|uniref:C2H2-type domain-containing protein n=1 Tax=Tigriopus californicus TaxID=6832 RepID=A0A553N745_TIGCA|nr:uncharacterized protein LOC131884445 isoform X1 [Tigriopus californicus]XP_059088209.1 uncharacterized protein LOC131884445 isoform X1 [Tigriopus californicus]XP_059089311.1 uncharacterized protein LOC131885309 isoform X1 [Tigriopus californicus]XP_059089312.1 uncharacterized protein LOC131885309 isoform X1 [Tigriopus californicus]TRY61258.1 hypothetical protein TCAL_04217 [Tigriopus californicus]